MLEKSSGEGRGSLLPGSLNQRSFCTVFKMIDTTTKLGLALPPLSPVLSARPANPIYQKSSPMNWTARGLPHQAGRAQRACSLVKVQTPTGYHGLLAWQNHVPGDGGLCVPTGIC